MLDQKIKDWKEAKEKLDYFKQYEKSLRYSICEEIINGEEGMPLTTKKTVKYECEFGKVTATAKTNLSIDRVEIEQNREKLTKEELDCLVFKPSILKSKLNELDESSFIFNLIEEKPASPTLSIK